MVLQDFLIRRDDLSQTSWQEAQERPESPLEPGQARLRVDRFSLTANNITYALLGDAMHYWNFFPAPEGWGRMPVWGYAEVVASTLPELREGERVYGYLPPSPYLRVAPERLSARGFMDGSAHRRALAEVYQRYERVQPSPVDVEDRLALLRPLFGTGLLIDDWLHAQQLFGARQVVLSSASSKTALGAAFMLSRRASREYQVVGLTSRRNRAFCERVGYYDRVLDYAELSKLAADVPTVTLDFAGNLQVLRDVHRHFAAALRHSALIGLTHREATLQAPNEELPGPKPELFFAPAHVQTGVKTWGPEGFAAHVAEGLGAFLTSTKAWLQIEHGKGQAAIEAAYRTIRDGQLEPDRGLVLQF